jgi:hypothetical protein
MMDTLGSGEDLTFNMGCSIPHILKVWTLSDMKNKEAYAKIHTSHLGLLSFGHCTLSGILMNIMFWQLNCSHPQVKMWEVPTALGS